MQHARNVKLNSDDDDDDGEATFTNINKNLKGTYYVNGTNGHRK